MSSLETYFSAVRKEFPALDQKIYNKRLAYLDSAATSLKPRTVVERIREYYLMESSNVHRGAHFLSDQGTRHFEESRSEVAKFLNARQAEEIVFVKGTTEGINLVAASFAGEFLKTGDEILITDLEHHANIVPWQLIAKKNQLHLVVAESTKNGELDKNDFKKKLGPRVKIVAVTGCSNTLGTQPDLEELIQWSHSAGAKVLVDAAQLIMHKKIDVQKLNCDFLVFSGHKIFGPTGIGVLYGKKELLDQMPPYQGGGSMISEVGFPDTTFNEVPFRFEAGTPHIEGVIGLRSALAFFNSLDIEKVKKWEGQLADEALSRLEKMTDLEIYGPKKEKGPIISFNLRGQHHSDVGSIMDREGVAIRAGHHCTQPLMKRLGIAGTLRASFAVYNSFEDVEQFVNSIKKAREILS